MPAANTWIFRTALPTLASQGAQTPSRGKGEKNQKAQTDNPAASSACAPALEHGDQSHREQNDGHAAHQLDTHGRISSLSQTGWHPVPPGKSSGVTQRGDVTSGSRRAGVYEPLPPPGRRGPRSG